MRPIILLIVTLGLFVHPAFGQDTTKVSTIEKVRALDNDVQELKDYVKSQKTLSEGTAKKIYEKNYNRLISTAELLRELNSTIAFIEKDKSQASVDNAIRQANNPSSDILGFKLTDVITTSLDETIKEKNIVAEKSSTVKSIVGNLIHGFGPIFPPLQFVSSIVSGISSFTDKDISIAPSLTSNIDGKIKYIKDMKFSAKTSTLDTAFIGSFTRKLAPYIGFYVELNQINTSFEDDLAKFSFLNSDITSKAAQLSIEFEQGTSVELHPDSSITNQVNKLTSFNTSGTTNFNHSDFNRKSEMSYVNENLESLYEFVKYFNEYARQYIYLVNRNIDNNKTQLKNAKKLPKAVTKTIDDLLTKIEKEQVGTEQNPGFITKYNKNISSITNKIKELRK
ncbi:MAG: hypothetical protein Q7J86_02555 [Bacteroidota bacterium]|nr:hypothetical protein [Bacteroidota bacterium]MDP3432519.1 hypothetical protein [Bacteroidota bacterium]